MLLPAQMHLSSIPLRKTPKMQSEKGMPTVFGQCLHSKGWLVCIYKAGEHVFPSGSSADMNALRSECQHPLSEHEGLPTGILLFFCSYSHLIC